jgi:DNA-3-methyladenine glycosylase II
MRSFLLQAVPPFRLDLTVWALRRRQRNLVDNWDGQTYSRVFFIERESIKISVTQSDQKIPELVVSTHQSISKEKGQHLSLLLTHVLGLDINLNGFYDFSKKDIHLKPLVEKYQGMKPPRFPSLFETLCNAVACQQLSLDAGISLLNHFSQAFGPHVCDQKNTLYAFPEPQVIKLQNPLDLKQVGFSLRKSETIIQLAHSICHKEFLPEPDILTDDELIGSLSSLKGIGRWSSEYALLRGLGRVHLFPQDDVGAQKNFQRFLHLRGEINNLKMQKIIKRWYPYAGLVYFLLLLKKLDEKGVL